MTTACAVLDCTKPTKSKGWCEMHYRRWYRYGSVDAVQLHRAQGPQRLWSKVDRSGECWIWLGSLDSNGYGNIRWDGRMAKAHRIALFLDGRPAPSMEMVVDHLCRNRRCVNPKHLEWVSHQENIIRASPYGTLGKANRAKTHCPQGHPYDEANTRYDSISRGNGVGRSCRACARERARMAYAQTKGVAS